VPRLAKLYTYYRSQASFRVRIALNLKGTAHEDRFLHLEKGDQFAAEYGAINPQMMVPTLIDGDVGLFQSSAILEYRGDVSGTAVIAPRPTGDPGGDVPGCTAVIDGAPVPSKCLDETTIYFRLRTPSAHSLSRVSGMNRPVLSPTAKKPLVV
jgi:hypothetical protein